MSDLKIFKKALIIVGLLFFCGCQKEREFTHLKGSTMGTTYNVKYLGAERAKLELHRSIDQLLININKEMSTYIKSSEISYFNSSARLSWVSVSKDFFEVTKYSLSLAKETGGIYDPTVGPLVNLWGFGPNSKKEVPSAKQIKDASRKVGFEKIILHESDLKMKKSVADVYLDLSSVAKGFGVDKIARFLESQKISNYMVEIGGEVRVKGQNQDQKPWQIAISSPNSGFGNTKLSKVLSLDNVSLATSGNYRNFFISEGKKYSHTLDPLLGRPVVNKLASVSVIDSRGCMQADALATALMALGLERGTSFAESKGIAAYFIYLKDGPNGQNLASVESSEFKTLFPKVDL
jgi:thiamine biosynthesis lipoprotein